jgi:AcrR family transcriptional regulator
MTRKGQAQVPAEERRKSILDTAYTLFVSQGYNGTSIRDIAKKSGCSLSNLYYYYQDKEAIFTAVFIENHPYLQLLPILNDAPEDENIRLMMRNIGQKMVAYSHDHPEFLNLVFIEMIEFQGQHLQEIAKVVLPSVQALTQRLRKAPGREVLRPLSPDLILRAFIGTFLSYAISKQVLSNLSPSADGNMDNIDAYIDIFLHGILQPDSLHT